MTAVAGHSAYVEVVVDAGEEALEGLTNFLWEQGAVGVVEEATADRPSRLRAFFPVTAGTDVLTARIDAYLEALRALGFRVGPRARLAPVADADWTAAWREHFRPVAVGHALLVAPPWEIPAASDCLALLEAIVTAERPARAIDLGTGSGILAIAAARLGVGHVLACDSDPDAVAATETNATLNGVAGRVRPIVGDAATLAAEPAPLVLANLLAAAHRALAERYARLVAPNGMLVAGGLLDAEGDDVAGALADHGFRRETTCRLEGWTSLALRHAPLHASA